MDPRIPEMKKKSQAISLRMLYAAAILYYGCSAMAQEEVISLYKGPAPGSENWDWQEQYMEQAKIAYNIVAPTLTVYRASPEHANGTAVIICPGGGFHFLSMENASRMAVMTAAPRFSR